MKQRGKNNYSPIPITGTSILPRAEVPRDLDIVPLPPGPFYIKIGLFFIQQFFNIY